MAVYFLCDIMDRITEIVNDGALFADITELPRDEDSPACLSFSAPDPDDECCEVDYETVDSVSDDDPCTIGDKACYAFTAMELSTIHHALTNALEISRNALKTKMVYMTEIRLTISSLHLFPAEISKLKSAKSWIVSNDALSTGAM